MHTAGNFANTDIMNRYNELIALLQWVQRYLLVCGILYRQTANAGLRSLLHTQMHFWSQLEQQIFSHTAALGKELPCLPLTAQLGLRLQILAKRMRNRGDLGITRILASCPPPPGNPNTLVSSRMLFQKAQDQYRTAQLQLQEYL